MTHSFSLWDLFTRGMPWPLGRSRDQSGVLRVWAKSVLVHIEILFGLLCAGTGFCACDCSSLRSCTDLHANLGWRDIWRWPSTSLLCEVQANLSFSGFSDRTCLAECYIETLWTQSISVLARVQPAGDHSPQLSTGQRSGGVLSPVLCFSVQERHRPPGSSPVEGPSGLSRAGAGDVDREAEAAALF